MTPTTDIDLTGLLGAAAAAIGLITAVCPLIQLRRILERGTAGDLSLTWLGRSQS